MFNPVDVCVCMGSPSHLYEIIDQLGGVLAPGPAHYTRNAADADL